jgi:predicted transcriptional regulator
VEVTFLGKTRNKILKYLRNNPRYSYNAKTLETELKENINTIRSELRRLHDKGFIHRETHGFYRVKLDSEVLYNLENPPTLLHGIMVSMKSYSQKLQNNIHGISAILCNFGFKQGTGRNKKRWTKSFFYEDDVDRRVTVTVHMIGRIDVYVNCSNHPVNYFEFRDILKFVEGNLSVLGPFGDQRVVEFGQAKDFRSVCMSGCNELSLRVFMNHWFRIYNKERLGVTRMEQHIRCDVPVSVLLDLFERMFLPVGNGFNGNGGDNSDGMFR